VNSNNDRRPSDDELHASLRALLRDGGFGEDEPADDDTVQREISTILGRANVPPAAPHESPAEGAPGGQDAQASQPRQPSRPLPARPGHPEPLCRPHDDRPPRKRPIRTPERRSRVQKSTRTGSSGPLLRTRGAEPFIQMVIFLVTVAAASAGILFTATGSAEIAAVAALVAIIVAQASRNINR
jgi:hypothetical protein